MNFIHDICKKYNITNYTINPDGSIDVAGDVDLSGYDLYEIPLNFNRVDGYFYCSYNNLTTLKGSPRWVGSSFSCDKNELTSLEFSPDYVGSWFSCETNPLTDNYCDTEIGLGFYTTLQQNGLEIDGLCIANNYNEWRKLYKRKKTLDELYTRHM